MFMFTCTYSLYKVKAEKQFKFEVNEISWNVENNLFFLTNGQGCIEVSHSLYVDILEKSAEG